MLLYLRHGVELLLVIQRTLWLASLSAETLLVARLISERLARKFPLFAAFLTAEVVCAILLMQFKYRSLSYAEAFRVVTLIMTLFRLGVAAELYERICEHFPGIGKFRAGMAAGLVLVAALLAMFTFNPNLAGQWAFPQTIVLVIQRFQSEIFAAALILTWIFLRYILSIRQPFLPNVVTHWRICIVYFGVSGAAHLAALAWSDATTVLVINSIMLTVQLGCFIVWFHLLRLSGEQPPAFAKLSPDQVISVEQYNQELLQTIKSLPGEISGRQSGNPDIPLHRARPL